MGKRRAEVRKDLEGGKGYRAPNVEGLDGCRSGRCQSKINFPKVQIGGFHGGRRHEIEAWGADGGKRKEEWKEDEVTGHEVMERFQPVR